MWSRAVDRFGLLLLDEGTPKVLIALQKVAGYLYPTTDCGCYESACNDPPECRLAGHVIKYCYEHVIIDPPHWRDHVECYESPCTATNMRVT